MNAIARLRTGLVAGRPTCFRRETVVERENSLHYASAVQSAVLPGHFKPEKKVVSAVLVMVTATYVYFLIFAQFGFLKVLHAAGVSGEVVKLVMAMMGVAGVAGSLLAARLPTVVNGQWHLAVGFALCALAAGASLAARSPGIFYGVALAVGAGLGFTTVTLVSRLRRAVGGAQLGTILGVSTGTAYGFCNLPAVFTASAEVQAGIAGVAALAGLIATRGLTLKASPDKPSGYDYTHRGMTLWVIVFLGLVCLDSAAFYIVQNTPVLRQTGWNESAGLSINAGVHLIAALLTGFALDRRWMGGAIFLAAVALCVACLLIDDSVRAFARGTILYTAAVSAYSTVLVFYPARGLRPGLAAAVYGVGGWIGSALGIGFAQGRTEVPWWFLGGLAAVIFGALWLRHRGNESQLRAFHA